jgi:DNA-binding NtrC family response regulator
MNSTNATILVVDDDADIRLILQDRLEALNYRVVAAATGGEALELVSQEEPDVMFLDLQMPGMDGIEVLKRLKGNTDLAIVIITAFGTIEKAVEAIKEGAFDFITKPFSPDHVDFVIRKALERKSLRQENRYLKSEMQRASVEIIGQNSTLRNATEVAHTVAQTASTVLLLGESGTGKEVFARAIHRWSPRATGPFVVVNCVALRDELLESELFGHEKGAFTGAHEMRKGKLEIAHGGTVFLDEIGDFKPDLQAKLLRVLQEREFERVGGNKHINVDIRIIAATNRDLPNDVKAGRFREDLFFRLNVVMISLPPLRERKDDLPALVELFLSCCCRTLKKPILKISANAMDHLMSYHWPGNVRELSNLIERAVILAKGPEIAPEDLPLLSAETLSTETAEGQFYHAAIRAYQKNVIRQALQSTDGNQAKAARLLGLQRTYLSRLIRKLNILPSDSDKGSS